MTPSRRNHRLRMAGVALVLLAALLGRPLLGLLAPLTSGGDSAEVDINSGRVRHRRTILGMPVGVRVEDSALTAALDPSDFAGRPADWRQATTFASGVLISSLYDFRTGTGQISKLEKAWSYGHMEPPGRRETARQVLRLWHDREPRQRAAIYLDAVWERSRIAGELGRTVTLADLPTP